MKKNLCVKNFIFSSSKAGALTLASFLAVSGVCVGMTGMVGATDRICDLEMVSIKDGQAVALKGVSDDEVAEPGADDGAGGSDGMSAPEEPDTQAGEDSASEALDQGDARAVQEQTVQEDVNTHMPVVLPEEVTQEAVDNAANDRAEEDKEIAEGLTDIATPSFSISVPRESFVLKSAEEGRATRMKYTVETKNLKAENEAIQEVTDNEEGTDGAIERPESAQPAPVNKKVVVTVGDVMLNTSGGGDGHLIRAYTFPTANPLPDTGSRARRNKYYEITEDTSVGGNMTCELIPSETIYAGHWTGKLEFTVRLVDADQSIEEVSGFSTEQLNEGEITVIPERETD